MRSTLALLALLAVVLPITPATADLGLADGDRVMFFTSTPLWPASFGMRVETFIRVKYPALKVRFWHWSPPSGATISKARERVDQHLAAFSPNVVVLNFGLAHGQSEAFRPSRLGAFRADLLGIIATCEESGARVVLVTPNCPEAHQKTRLTKSKYDEVVGRYAEAVRKVASEKELLVADWYAATVGREAASKLTIDGLWPTELGATLGAECFVEAIGAEPIDVAFKVDWPTLECEATAGSVSAVRQSESVVSIDLHGLPLPWSAPARGRVVQPCRLGSPMCRLTLRLENVPPGGVSIASAGKKAATFTEDAVAAGIDLASLGPIARASQVVELVGRIKGKNKTINQFERLLANPLEGPEFAEANRLYLEAMVAEVDGVGKVIDRTPRAMDVTLEVRLLQSPGE